MIQGIVKTVYFEKKGTDFRGVLSGVLASDEDNGCLGIYVDRKRVKQVDVKLTENISSHTVGTKLDDFLIQIEHPIAEITQGIEVWTICNKKRAKKIFAVSIGKIKKILDTQGVSYHIDSVQEKAEQIEVRGWAASLFGDPVDLYVTDQQGNKIAGVRTDCARSDVSQILGFAEVTAEPGFSYKFVGQKNQTYILHLSTSETEVRCTVLQDEREGGVRGRTKQFANRLRILKAQVGSQKELFRLLKNDEDAGKLEYEKWYRKYRASANDLREQKKQVFPFMPKISIVVPLYHTPEKYLKEMIRSVQKQTYGNWELCLSDGAGRASERIVRAAAKKDSRILYQASDYNLKIADNTNAAISMVSGEYVGFLDHDDLLAPNALFEVVKKLNKYPETEMIYSDEDKVDENGKRHSEPYFKSDFNLDLLRSNNYICHFLVIKRALIEKTGKFDVSLDGAQDHDYILRCVEKTQKIEHIPEILYHWRIHAQSTAGSGEAKEYCRDAGCQAIQNHLDRMGISAIVEKRKYAGFYDVKYPVIGNPKISVIIPNRNEKESLKKCIDSIFKKTDYDNFEIIIVENNSTEKEIFEYYRELEKNEKIKVVVWQDEFNYSAINNFGVRQATGEYLLLLNNDIEVISHGWMTRMLADCCRPEVGIVGAKLYYPDDTIQHAGVVLGIGGVAGHIFKGLGRNEIGYFLRPGIQQDLSAVTAACLLVKRSVYEEVEGLEEALKVAFNDVDFCLKVRAKGYLIVLEPSAELYHYESKSRGSEDTPQKIERFQREIAYMQKKWHEVFQKGDPYYNRHMTLKREDCSLGKPERW